MASCSMGFDGTKACMVCLHEVIIDAFLHFVPGVPRHQAADRAIAASAWALQGQSGKAAWLDQV